MKTTLLKNGLLLFSFISLLFVSESCKKDCGLATKGKGSYITYTVDKTGFEAVKNSISAKVYIKQATAYSITIKAQENLQDVIRVRIINNELILDFACNNVRHDGIEVWIEMPTINALSVNGSGELIGQSLIESNSLNLNISGSGKINMATNADLVKSKISGSGKITLTGTAKNADYDISGSGDIHAFDLDAQFVNANISGSGNIECSASSTLYVRISGSGKVYYKGNPQINSSVSGSGRLINAN